MRILIFTSGKTGSTALAGMLLDGLPDHKLVFEPKRLEGVADDDGNIIVKSLAMIHWGTEVGKFSSYDKRLHLTRHPFDVLISALLYAPYNGRGMLEDTAAREYLALIQRKAAKPSSTSVLSICDRFKELSGFDLFAFIDAEVRCHCEFHSEFKHDFWSISYQQLISGSFEGLKGYLGFDVRTPVVPKEYQRVSRGGRSGDWRLWFLESDRDYLADRWEKFFSLYKDFDPLVPLDLPVSINAEDSWQYVLKMMNQNRLENSRPVLEA